MSDARNLLRQIQLKRTKQDELRRINDSIDQLRRSYSFAHGYRVPMTEDQCERHIEQEARRG